MSDRKGQRGAASTAAEERWNSLLRQIAKIAAEAEELHATGARSELMAAMSRLIPEERTTLVRHYLHERTYEEIARELSVSETEVESLIDNAKHRLAEILFDLGSLEILPEAASQEVLPGAEVASEFSEAQTVAETNQAVATPGVEVEPTTRARPSRQTDEPRIESGRVKLTVNIPEREMVILRKLATKRDISLTDAVRRAIAMEQFLEEVERDGGKLLVEQPDRTIRQVVVR